MGERCYVTITVRRSDFDRLVAKLCGDREQFMDEALVEECYLGEDYVDLVANEVNWAEWPELEDILRSHGVEYDKVNGEGIEIDPGTSYFRRNVEGEIVEMLFVEERDNGIANFLKNLLTMNSDEMRREIEREYLRIKPFEITAL